MGKQRANESKGSRRLPGCRPQQVSCKATKLTRDIQQTSVRRQVPLGHPVCRQNRTIPSWHLQRTRCGTSKNAQVTNTHHARVALSSIDLRTAIGIAVDPLYQTRRDQCSAAPALDQRSCVSFEFFCGKTPSCNSIFSNMK